MKDIFATDVRSYNEFERIGYHYTKVEETDKWCLWKMEKGNLSGYELWKYKPRKNPDGTVVWVKPSDEDFGIYGWYYPNDCQKLRDRISEIEQS